MAERERRRSPRTRVAKGSVGRLRATVPFAVLDVSEHGMLLELSTSLRPGSVYDLKADLPGCPFGAQVRITRCTAGGYAEDGRGGRLLLFRAGAEFIVVDEGEKKAVKAFLVRNAGNERSASGVLKVKRG